MSTRRHDRATTPKPCRLGIALVVASGCYYGNQDGPALVGNTFAPESESADAGDVGDEPEPLELGCETEWQWAQAFLRDNCATCHGPAPSPGRGDLTYVTDIGRLLQHDYLLEGDGASSPLVKALRDDVMPPAEVEARPRARDIARLRGFVDACTGVPLGGCQGNPIIGLAEQSQAMFEDLSARVRNDDKPFVRYVSFTHLYNAGYCSTEIEPYRVALNKLVNSMSDQVQLVSPFAIDAEETLYRIDLRDYGWDEPVGDAPDAWAALTASSPYAFRRFDDGAEALTDLTGSDVPYLMGDALLRIALEPPLYYDLTRAPESLASLEERLGISLREDIDERNVARAGLLESRVSRNHRVVERHDLPQGAGQSLWITYDFFDSAAPEQSLLTTPLDYRSGMSEVIYTLPNGLHTFLVFDGEGQRIDRGFEEIVVDFGQPDGDVVAGVSCFRCHGGILPAEDRVREFALAGLDFTPRQKELIDALYLPPEAFGELVGRDTQRVVNTTAAIGLDARAAVEPASDVYARFDVDIDLRRAAAELGLGEKELFRNISALDSVLQPLTIGPIKRNVWSSRFPSTVCRLNLGETDDEACLDEGTSSSGGEDGSSTGDDGVAEDDSTTGTPDPEGESEGSSGGGEPPYDPWD